VRCELKNIAKGGALKWEMALVFGSPSSIHEMVLREESSAQFVSRIPKGSNELVRAELAAIGDFVRDADVRRMQDLWSRRGPGSIRPFMMIDRIDRSAAKLVQLLINHRDIAEIIVKESIRTEFGTEVTKIAGVGKLTKHAPVTVAALIITSVVNHALDSHGTQVAPELRGRFPRREMRPFCRLLA
jgi:DNA (cytosine-5)-methyltransferase 1